VSELDLTIPWAG